MTLGPVDTVLDPESVEPVAVFTEPALLPKSIGDPVPLVIPVLVESVPVVPVLSSGLVPVCAPLEIVEDKSVFGMNEVVVLG